jgi:hypothetical protein
VQQFRLFARTPSLALWFFGLREAWPFPFPATLIFGLESRMEAAREEARQKALEGIKAAGQKDWRALAEWLKLTFPEHRQGNNINVSATAGVQQATEVVVTEEQRRRLIALREKLLNAPSADGPKQ